MTKRAAVIGWGLLIAGVVLWFVAAAAWSDPANMSIKDAHQDAMIATAQVEIRELSRRVTAIEDRLFAVLLAAGGSVLASAASAVFSYRGRHHHLSAGQDL